MFVDWKDELLIYFAFAHQKPCKLSQLHQEEPMSNQCGIPRKITPKAYAYT